LKGAWIEDETGAIHRMCDEHTPHIKVGIYWSVDEVIVGAAVTLEMAEPYGDALQHGGHYEFWEKLHACTEAELKLKSHAYDFYPRGRVVCFPLRQTVRLYVDSCMDSDVLNAALDFFEHQEYEIEIETDEHYRCSRCNPNFMDEEATEHDNW
jgi:hypothetical protein